MAPDPRLAPGGWAEVARRRRRARRRRASRPFSTSCSTTAARATSSARRCRCAASTTPPITGCAGQPARTRQRHRHAATRWRSTARPWCGWPWMRCAPGRGSAAWTASASTSPPRSAAAPTASTPPRRCSPRSTQDPELRVLKAHRRAVGHRPGRLPARRLSRRLGRMERPFPRQRCAGSGAATAGLLGELRRGSRDRPTCSAPSRRPSRSVNFVVAHDGFTLADLVSYERKHNEANGEQNRDGTDANYSWNNGAEGADRRPRDPRRPPARPARLLATLLLARGTPMLAMGAEFGHSQGGNNNAYAQDNAIGWLDWDEADKTLFGVHRAPDEVSRGPSGAAGDCFLSGERGGRHANPRCRMAQRRWRADAAQRLEQSGEACDCRCALRSRQHRTCRRPAVCGFSTRA